MSKEVVDEIRKALEEAQAAENIRGEKGVIRQQEEATKREAEHQALLAQNEAKLRETGVVNLFEQLRDSRVITMSDSPVIEYRAISFLGIEFGTEKVKIADYVPAIIRWKDDMSGISIEFDSHSVYQGRNWDDLSDVYYHYTHLLKAEITESGRLKIGEHLMEQGTELGGVVRDEILRLRGLKE